MRTQSLKVLPLLKPGVGQYIAMHATLTSRDFFLANFYPSGPFTCVFFFVVVVVVFSLFIFHGHSTREPAPSRVTYFILRAFTGTRVSYS